jgi:hypothetical protein
MNLGSMSRVPQVAPFYLGLFGIKTRPPAEKVGVIETAADSSYSTIVIPSEARNLLSLASALGSPLATSSMRLLRNAPRVAPEPEDQFR